MHLTPIPPTAEFAELSLTPEEETPDDDNVKFGRDNPVEATCYILLEKAIDETAVRTDKSAEQSVHIKDNDSEVIGEED